MRSLIAVFPVQLQAKRAIEEVANNGLNTKNMTLITRDPSAGCLEGTAFLLVPGLGPLIVMGPIVAWIIDALQTPVIVEGVSALGAGLVSLGVPVEDARGYEWSVRAGRSLLISFGSQDDMRRIYEMLRILKPISIDTRPVPPEPAIPAA